MVERTKKQIATRSGNITNNPVESKWIDFSGLFRFINIFFKTDQQEQMRITGVSTPRPHYVGARNPYALADAIKKANGEEPIVWSEISDRIGTIENILGGYNTSGTATLSYRELFDPSTGSVIFCQKKIIEIANFDVTLINSKKYKPPILKPPRSIISSVRTHARFYAKIRAGENTGGGTGGEANVGAEKPWDTACSSVAVNWSNIKWDPKISNHYPRVDAPLQGCPPDCWLIAAMSSIAWTYSYFSAPLDNIDGSYIVITDTNQNPLFDNPTTDIIPLNSDGKPAYAHSKLAENWPAIIEYHMAQVTKPGLFVANTYYPDISRIETGDPMFAASNITNQPYDSSNRKQSYPNNGVTLDQNTTWNDLNDPQFCDKSYAWPSASFNKTLNPTVAWTYCSGSKRPIPTGCTAENSAPALLNTGDYSDEILVASHAYSLLGTIVENGQNYVILRNPWGGIPYGSEYYLHAPENPLYHLADPLNICLYLDDPDYQQQDYLLPLVQPGGGAPSYRPVLNGIFGLRIDDFVRYFSGYGRV